MKRANLFIALFWAAATSYGWGQTYYNTSGASQDQVLAQALIGTWEPDGNNSSYSAYASTSEQITFYSNGAYEYTSTTIVSMGDYSNDGQETDTGLWKLQGNILYSRSGVTGQVRAAQLQMIRPDAIYVEGKLWIKQSASGGTTEESPLESSTSELATEETFVGEYLSHDRAIQVQNEIRNRGFDAWIKHLGCFTCTPSTRTYAVYAMLPAQ